MGYHHCNLPDLKTLKSQYESLGLDKFVARYSKCQALIGDSECVEFVESMFRLLKEINSK